MSALTVSPTRMMLWPMAAHRLPKKMALLWVLGLGKLVLQMLEAAEARQRLHRLLPTLQGFLIDGGHLQEWQYMSAKHGRIHHAE